KHLGKAYQEVWTLSATFNPSPYFLGVGLERLLRSVSDIEEKPKRKQHYQGVFNQVKLSRKHYKLTLFGCFRRNDGFFNWLNQQYQL
ncbi:MAG: hypothetical protein AAFQ57_15240, partial [Cyanobacteria bacterium J06626_14]